MGTTSRKVFQPVPADVERVGKVVLDAACVVHTELGPGLLESVYQVARKHVIESNGAQVDTEVKLPIIFPRGEA
jgi:GxxExxY protein